VQVTLAASALLYNHKNLMSLGVQQTLTSLWWSAWLWITHELGTISYSQSLKHTMLWQSTHYKFSCIIWTGP